MTWEAKEPFKPERWFHSGFGASQFCVDIWDDYLWEH